MKSNEISQHWNKVVCVDLDGTILEYPKDIDSFGMPKSGAKAALAGIRERGFRIIIHTARPKCQEVEILAYLENQGIKVDGINVVLAPWGETQKPLADLYIDDRGFRFTGSWERDLKAIYLLLKETNNGG